MAQGDLDTVFAALDGLAGADGERALRVNVGYDLSVSRRETGHSVTAGLKYAW